MVTESQWIRSSLVILLVGLSGCGKPASPTGTDAHAHGEWWCAEHGVPEAECAQCNTKLAGELKAAGDWCEKHSVPESQCFVCHPDFEARFAAKYEAKYGEKPPTQGAGHEGHDHAHGTAAN